MNYVVAIEPGDKRHAFGVVVPDLPGCFSAGDTLDEALVNAREAMELWLETVIDDGQPVPEPKTLATHQAKPEFAGWIWAVVAVDLAALSDKVERINITLPSRVLRRIDQAAKQAGESRSAYLARRALA
jgi:predicted RNase H-like HicB family nuclease